jgi:propionyl-CoA carboxylase alpha chain
VDLVEMQVAVAEGGSVDVEVGPPRGHAVEVRLYAEDPAAGWQPQTGTLTTFDIPDVAAELTSPDSWGVRLDSGFVTGSEVGTHYDAMLAKVICWAPSRAAALRQLAGVLGRARLHGVRTNRDLLVEVLRHPDFVAGEVSTDFLDTHDLAALVAVADAPGLRLAATAAALALVEADARRRTTQPGLPVGWRNVTSQPQRKVLAVAGSGDGAVDEDEVTVEWWGARSGYVVDDVTVVSVAPDSVRLEVDGVASTWQVTQTRGHKSGEGVPGTREVWVDGPLLSACLREVPRFTDPADAVAAGSLHAPMPGSVLSVAVEAGQRVTAGQPLLVMEAMKMQHTVSAPTDGVVTSIDVRAGSQVAAGDVLAVVEVAP